MSYVSALAAFTDRPLTKGSLLPDKTRVDGFREFVEAHERKIRPTLTAALGYDLGRDAAAESAGPRLGPLGTGERSGESDRLSLCGRTSPGYSGKYMDLQVPSDIAVCTVDYFVWETAH
jgi:hypothetical protein